MFTFALADENGVVSGRLPLGVSGHGYVAVVAVLKVEPCPHCLVAWRNRAIQAGQVERRVTAVKRLVCGRSGGVVSDVESHASLTAADGA